MPLPSTTRVGRGRGRRQPGRAPRRVRRRGTHSGNPVGAETAWTLPPGLWALPEYHTSICSPLTLVVFSPQRSAPKTFPSKDQVRETFLVGTVQGFVQVGGLGREGGDAVVVVAVGGGTADAECRAEHRDIFVFAEPCQQHQHLFPAGQRPAAAGVPCARRCAGQCLVLWR